MLSGDIHPASLGHAQGKMCLSSHGVTSLFSLGPGLFPAMKRKKKKKIYNTKKQSNYETLKCHKLPAQKIVIYDIAVS